MILERQIQKIYPDKWEELEKINKRNTAVEKRIGFPPKRRYQGFAGNHGTDTLIIELEWESFAAMEAAYEKILADPEHQALQKEVGSIVKSNRWELYFVLE
jgi:hypothetical protein